MTLREQIQEINEKTAKILGENPGTTNVWWQIMDADLEEMRELETEAAKIEYCGPYKRMRLNPYEAVGHGVVLFIFSKPVKVKESIEIIEIETLQPA